MPDEGSLSPYWQGFYAPQYGNSLADCPFPVGSPEWRDWCEGWKEANGIVDDEEGKDG